MAIRPYEPGDRGEIRRICCDTADKGEPLERLFPDREVFADWVTRYYTDFEPSSTWVADHRGGVVGYLTGCLNPSRYRRITLWRIAPQALIRAMVRGAFLHPQTWGLLGAGLKIWRRGGFRPAAPLEGYPAHLHINLMQQFRGRRIGERLIQRFIEQAQREGLKGIHLVTREDNLPARRFFQQVGFLELGRRLAPPKGGESRLLSRAVIYGKRLAFLLLFFLSCCCAQAEEPPSPEIQFAPKDRILVLAPHPDDEVLGASGIVQRAAALGLPLKILFLTYGDSNQWSFLLYRKHPVWRPEAVRQMGMVRCGEACEAARLSGVPPEQLIFLGYPDFGTFPIWNMHWGDRPPLRSLLARVTAVPYDNAFRPGALYKGEEILQDLETVLRQFHPTKIFVSHPADHHPDHRALYLFTRVALWDLEGEMRPELYPYLVHFEKWPRPVGLHPTQPLQPPQALEAQIPWKIYPLKPEEVERKRAALKAHRTQVNSGARPLLSFVRANELFGDFPVVRLHPNSTETPLFPAGAEGLREAPEELTDEERAAFIGLEWRSVRLEGETLVFSIELSRPLAKAVEVSLDIFGYRNDRPFARMPKIHVRLGEFRDQILDQDQGLPRQAIQVTRGVKQLTLRIPLELLGNPQRILTSARTYLGEIPLDWISWRVIEYAF
ncbi:MAG: GNAT family N-acetyltransferase [Candidatus Omnitrophica bacterium]|nr:GNAT family N-acetyltransferase [Candidatus Omnitrophota bacterium]